MTDRISEALEFSRGAELIARERQRHIDEEGYTAKQDDAYSGEQLLKGALSYLQSARRSPGAWAAVAHAIWPWKRETFKPKDDIRDLVRAGSLVAAEIDRRLRAQTRATADNEQAAALPFADDADPVPVPDLTRDEKRIDTALIDSEIVGHNRLTEQTIERSKAAQATFRNIGATRDDDLRELSGPEAIDVLGGIFASMREQTTPVETPAAPSLFAEGASGGAGGGADWTPDPSPSSPSFDVGGVSGGLSGIDTSSISVDSPSFDGGCDSGSSGGGE